MIKKAIDKGTKIVQAHIQKNKPPRNETEDLEEPEGIEFLGEMNEGNSLHLEESNKDHQETTRKKFQFPKKGKKLLNAVGKKMKDRLVIVRSEVNSCIKALDTKAKEILAQQKEKLNTWLRCQVERIVLSLLAKAPPKVKSGLKDPDMPKCIQKAIDDLVDELWPDVQEEILFHLHCAIDKPVYSVAERDPPPCYMVPLYKVRSWYLYTKDPCKSLIELEMIARFGCRLNGFLGGFYFCLHLFLAMEHRLLFSSFNFFSLIKEMSFNL